MRRFFRSGPGALILLSAFFVLAVGSCLLLKRKTGRPKPAPNAGPVASDGAGAPSMETDGDVLTPPGSPDIEERADQTPSNGTVFVKAAAGGIVPLTVELKGNDSCYIYLKYLYPSDNDGSAGDTGGDGDIGFFAAAGRSVSLDIPPGVYRLYYAAGTEWHGPEQKFGPQTRFFKINEKLTFNVDGNRLHGAFIQLLPQPDDAPGQITQAEFPG